MIISHRHRFIFVKTAKTAGSSVEVFLSSICADEDVVTPLNPPEEGHQPRNHSGLFNPWRELLSGNRKTRRITLRDWRNQARYWSHLPARLAVCRLGKERWCSYFKFSVERNPWDKTLSHYHMVNTMRGGGLDFDAYLKKRKFCWNHPIYTDWDGRTLLVDRILRYEFLDIELGEICRHLGLPYPGKLLPRSKGGLRKDRRHYREVYTPEQAGVVKQAFEREISLHGYEY